MNKFCTTAVAVIWTLALFAQETTTAEEFRNEVGIEFLGLFNSDFQVTYERALGRKISVSGGFGYKFEDGLITFPGLDTESIQTDDFTYSGAKVNLAAKYYLNEIRGGNMTGFYVGAYLKLQNYDSNINGGYINDANEQFDVDFDTDMNIKSLGLMLGYKLSVSKRIFMDFLIFGPGVGRHRYEITENVPLPDEFYDDLNDALSKYGLFDFLDAEFDFDGETKDSKFNLLAFRYAITLSYAF